MTREEFTEILRDKLALWTPEDYFRVPRVYKLLADYLKDDILCDGEEIEETSE